MPDTPIEVFFSYAHEDELLRNKLANHLKVFERQKIISGWYDRQITAGSAWAGQIDEHLNTAQVILLLISDDFLASDYCYDTEMQRALERHSNGEARVIPIILRPCAWESAPFGKLQALPKYAWPVTKWRPRDDAFLSIIEGIKSAINTIKAKAASSPQHNVIPFAQSLVDTAIDYYSTFISYSSKNQDFAMRLHADLQSKGVRCWFAPEDIKIGDKFRQRIDEAIRIHDKLLVILSADSISSAWVEEEVESAIEREHKENRSVLFPVRIDDAVINSDQAWAASLRRMRHIGDFSKWKDQDSYRKAFDRLLHDLKSEA